MQSLSSATPNQLAGGNKVTAGMGFSSFKKKALNNRGPGPWHSAWSLAIYMQKQVSFMPNSYVAISYLAEVTNTNFDI